MTKQCGDCTQCCKTLGVEELAKPPGAWCGHRRPGAGCSIYEARPQTCRQFSCQWLLDPAMPQALRPDRVRVVLDADEGGRRLIARCDAANPTAWKREPMRSALNAWAAEAWPSGREVIVKAGNHIWLITPTGDIDIGALGPGERYVVTVGPDGKYSATVRAAGEAG